MEFRIIQGLNRTQNQTENPWCIFSRDFGNVNGEYFETNTDYPNIAYVYGESKSENSSRMKVTVDESLGEEKREIFVDAGDIKQEEMSDTDYVNALKQRGRERLAEDGRFETIDFVIDPSAQMPFGLGDICTYKNMELNKTYNLRITEIKETHEQGGVKKNIVLGRYNLGLVEAIRKGVN